MFIQDLRESTSIVTWGVVANWSLALHLGEKITENQKIPRPGQGIVSSNHLLHPHLNQTEEGIA